MQTSVVMHLDTSFEHVRQDPGFKRRLLWDISAALRVPQRFIKVAAVEEDGSKVAVHLVLQDSEKSSQELGTGDRSMLSSSVSPARGGRTADELATELWRQARLADSNLRLGSCSGQVSRVEIQGAGAQTSSSRLASTRALAAHNPPAPMSPYAPASIEAARSIALSPQPARHGAGSSIDSEKAELLAEIERLQRANRCLNAELVHERSTR
jgi:hypothetical protein